MDAVRLRRPPSPEKEGNACRLNFALASIAEFAFLLHVIAPEASIFQNGRRTRL